MKNKFAIQLDVSNIGPHYKSNEIHLVDTVESNKAVFYAENGVGKSFISRAFRLFSNQGVIFPTDDLLSFETEIGHLAFKIMCDGTVHESIVSVKRGESIKVINGTEFIFHVFNSDFIEENLKSNNYNPDGKIEGYILGKGNIDVTAEKAILGRFEIELSELEIKIDNEVALAKKELQKEGVVASTREFGLIWIGYTKLYRKDKVVVFS